ncbi:MAG: COP23 domain-containing protein [Prochlorothrix sp.]|nr:COP23 domain-containing protein [Prochlorothrix sp.]
MNCQKLIKQLVSVIIFCEATLSLSIARVLAQPTDLGEDSPFSTESLLISDTHVASDTDVTYECLLSPEGIPTTYARLDGGTQNIPLIRWQSNYFSRSGWSERTRCIEVSQRFQAFNEANQLRYLIPTYVQSNSGVWYPVICTTPDPDSTRCGGLLITLPLGENPNIVLEELAIAVRQGTFITLGGDEFLAIDLEAQLRLFNNLHNHESVYPLFPPMDSSTKTDQVCENHINRNTDHDSGEILDNSGEDYDTLRSSCDEGLENIENHTQEK